MRLCVPVFLFISVTGCIDMGSKTGTSRVFRYYYPDSTLFKLRTIESDEGPLREYWKFYYRNGNLAKQGMTVDSKATGLWVFYYDSGEKQSETYFRNDVRHGHTIHYWRNGKKKAEGDYAEGRLHGKWTAWYESGWKEREGLLVRGRETGLWTTWDVEGDVFSEIIFEDGKPTARLVSPD